VKKITLANYKKDTYYPRIVRAVAALLAKGEVVAPVDLFVRMELLRAEDLEAWRFGRVPYLEKVIRCNLAKASRILRIFRMHAHDLNLRPSQTSYKKWGKGHKVPLRFSKSGRPGLEEAYSRHFLAPGKKAKAVRPPPRPEAEVEIVDEAPPPFLEEDSP
jgi:hypothetical protein